MDKVSAAQGSRVCDVAQEKLDYNPDSLKKWLRDIPLTSIANATNGLERFVPHLQDEVQMCEKQAQFLLLQGTNRFYLFFVVSHGVTVALTALPVF